MIVFCPVMISSTKPLSSPSLSERLRKSGRTLRVIYRVKRMEMGIVTAKTRTSIGDMASIITRDPTTVIALVATWRRSLEREALTVSMS